MEEITQIDQRATVAAHETDRTSFGLLAKVYQRLIDQRDVAPIRDCSEHPSGTKPTELIPMQEAQS